MRFTALTTIIFSFFVVQPAFAHSDQPSFERTVDGFLVDVGYTIAYPMPGQLVTFDFDLYSGTGETINYASFNTVTFTVMQNGSTVFSKVIQNTQPNVPTFTYAFPRSGTYDLSVTYDRGNLGTVATTFQLPVTSQTASGSTAPMASLVAIAVVLATVLWIVVRRKRR